MPVSTRISRARALLSSAELYVALLVFLVVYTLNAKFAWFTSSRPLFQHLGAEYYNIAIALADGRGFSDPFAELTGSTAWMPPLYTWFLAALLKLTGTREQVAQIVHFSTMLAFSAVGVMLFRIARSYRSRLSPWVAVGAYVLWLWSFHTGFFMLSHDVWLLLLLATIAVWLVVVSVERRQVSAWRWGLLCGTCTLASPALATALLGLGVTVYCVSREHRRHLRAALLLAVCLAAPWMVRNAVVFHAFIPTKSNMFYEAYQANYADDDGIYDGDFKGHPYLDPSSRFKYAQLGEARFMAEYKAEFLASLKADPWRYLRNVGHRALAVTVYYVPMKIWPASPSKLALQRVLQALPLGGLLVCLLFRHRAAAALRPVAVLAGMYVLPYALVAFYTRYLLPLSSILILMAYFGSDQLVEMFAARRARRKRGPELPAPSTTPVAAQK